MAGKGVTSPSAPPSPDLHDPEMPGLLPADEAEDVEKEGGAWFTCESEIVLLEDFVGFEKVLAVEMSDVEALEPQMLVEAKHRLDWPLWEKAIEEELATLKKASTWRMEEAPPEANVINSKWVFKAKKDAVGNITHYKAQLVAQGFSQIGGVDYDDIYTPVAKMASFQAIIAMANKLGLVLHQVDIKGAYLNRVLNDDKVLYMVHPPGYKPSDAAKCVLHLLKAIYGLKQAACRWYQKLRSIFFSLGFNQSAVDQAMFYKLIPQDKHLIVVTVHVDDCTIATSMTHLVEDLKAGLSHHIKVTDLSELHWMLGIQVQCDQEAHTKPLSMLMDTQVRLTSEQAPLTTAEFMVMHDVPYCKAVSALNWAVLAMHPDIAFAVAMVTCFGTNPGPVHWEAIKQIFHYLAGTQDLWLSYGETRHILEGYVDTDGSMAEDW